MIASRYTYYEPINHDTVTDRCSRSRILYQVMPSRTRECQNVRDTPAITPWLRYSRIGMLERFDSME